MTGLWGDAVRLLEQWSAPDREQAELREHFLAHLREHADGMWRECRPEHVTASALVVRQAADEVLLTLHKTVGRWLQVGGHCERTDVTLAGAALREALEETGLTGLTIDPDPLQLSRHELLAGGCRGCLHLDVQFLVTATAGTGFVVSAESEDLGWFPADALPAGTDHVVEELVVRAQERGAVGRRSVAAPDRHPNDGRDTPRRTHSENEQPARR